MLYHSGRLGGKLVYHGGHAAIGAANAASQLAMATRPDTRTKQYKESMGMRVVGGTAKIGARHLLI